MQVDLNAIVALINDHGVHATLDHTGGGTGTIHAGRRDRPMGEGETGHEAVVGPGSYHTGMADSEGLCVGPQDLYGENEVTYFEADTTEAQIARFVVNYVHGSRVKA